MKEVPGMLVLDVRNVHEALHRAIKVMNEWGEPRPSRNGNVFIPPFSVTTVYRKPLERVVFWSDRDANPFFHLYESLWMLAGRRDVAGPAKFAKQIAQYSDDSVNFHAAYGYRWRHHFSVDQLRLIADQLRRDPNSRRCVLQMWETDEDLGREGKDFPCNVTATFQRDQLGALDLTVFCRSNDIIWGAYGANAVHFSFLLEYMASWIGCAVGKMVQISVNWHAYEKTYEQCLPVIDLALNQPYRLFWPLPLPPLPISKIDDEIQEILKNVDNGWLNPQRGAWSVWASVVDRVLRAHHCYQSLEPPQKFQVPIDLLTSAINLGKYDWLVASLEWIQRRQRKAELR